MNINFPVENLDLTSSKHIDMDKAIREWISLMVDIVNMARISDIGAKLDAVIAPSGMIVPELQIYWDTSSNRYTTDRKDSRARKNLPPLTGTAKDNNAIFDLIRSRVGVTISAEEIVWASMVIKGFRDHDISYFEGYVVKSKEINADDLITYMGSNKAYIAYQRVAYILRLP